MSPVVPSTPIIRLYDELHQRGISRHQKLARAQQFVANPGLLAALFRDSVTKMSAYRPASEGYYKSRTHYEVGDVMSSSTTDLALRIRDADGLSPAPCGEAQLLDTESLKAPGVTGVPASSLACDFLDRELVATRTTGGVTHEGTAVRLDLLLCNSSDGTPIIAEVKRTSDVNPLKHHYKPATDQDPFSALVQALACAAQLATPAQYARLTRWGRTETRGQKDYPAEANIAACDPPVFDIYVVLHNRPQGTHLPELGAEAERLGALLLAQPSVSHHVRRIACLLTQLDAGQLHAQAQWAYERPKETAGSRSS
jgi:hypothetical protein